MNQWTSYGWNVFTLSHGNDYGEVAAVLKAMDEVDPHDRRPIVAIGKTTKGYWPAAVDGKIPGYDIVSQWTSYGWNVFTLTNGNDYGQVAAVLKAMDAVDPHDRRPIAAIGKTIKGYWPKRLTEKFPASAAINW